MGIRVAIIEVEKRSQNSLSTLLNSNCKDTLEVLGIFYSSGEAIEAFQHKQPDVVLIDFNPPDSSWIEIILEIKSALPALKVLVFTVCEDKSRLFRALRAGVSGYLLKVTSPGEIIKAIKETYRCGAPMSPGIGSYIIEYFLEKEGATQRNCLLTKREQEILKGIADGLTYKQLADRLFISPYTVRTHIRNIYEKLHVRCKIEAVTKGKEVGVL